MSILVTGGAGFIGSQLIDALLAEGSQVVSLDSFHDFYDPKIKEKNLAQARDHDGFSEVRGDVRNSHDLNALPHDIEVIVHLAALAGVRRSIQRPVEYADVNVMGTLNLLELARMRGLREFVFGSSSSVYGNSASVPFAEDDPVARPISPYAATKRAGELLCHTHSHLYGLSSVCLRFFTVYGPRQRPDLAIHKFSRLMRSGVEIPIFGDGSSERDYTYIDDILQGVLGALRYVHANDDVFDVINLGESRTISLREMIELLSRALGVRPMIATMPSQPGDVTRTHADISRARRLLDYAPGVDFEEGIARFVRWFDHDPAAAMTAV